MVESAVRTVVGEERIAKNVNADEAAVMGAALYGAGITRGFRTKDIRVHDLTPFGIDISYESVAATEGESSFERSRSPLADPILHRIRRSQCYRAALLGSVPTRRQEDDHVPPSL